MVPAAMKAKTPIQKTVRGKISGFSGSLSGENEGRRGTKDDCEVLIQQTQEAVLQDKRRDSIWLKGSLVLVQTY